MKNIGKMISVVCAAAAFAGNAPMIPVSAETVKKPMYYAAADTNEITDFNRIDIDWGGSAPDEYTIECSDDNQTWTELTTNVSEKDSAADFSFNEARNSYVYKDYHTRYVRVVADEDLSGTEITISRTEDVAPNGNEMQVESSDGQDIKASSAEVFQRLNDKTIFASSYIYWSDPGSTEYNFDEASIIIPLGGEKEISRFEIASYFNSNTGTFQNFFAKNYDISYINSSQEVHADSEGWVSLKSGAASSGWLTARFDAVKATHVKFTQSGGGVNGKNNNKIATFLSYIGIYSAAAVPAAMSYGSYDIDAEVPDYAGTVDLVLFMGQSNMAGRGEAADSTVCSSGHGYEFRAISDPTRLYDVKEPFGVNENNAASGVNEPGSKTGSMVSALMEEYYSYTGVPMVGVSCSKGGSQISFWQPGSPALDDAAARYKSAKRYLKDNGYTVRRSLMVWCQGESDADVSTPISEYKEMTQTMAQAMLDEGIDKCFMVRIGHKNDTSGKYDPYIEAQSELCESDDRFVMVSEKFADYQADMKDLYHYHQVVYNIVGADAGKNIAAYYGDTTKRLPSTIDIIDTLKTETEAGVTIENNKDIIAALYKKSGELEQIKQVPGSEKPVTVKFTTTPESKTIKLFDWDSLEGMKPIGESKSINIDSIKPKTSATVNDFLYGSYEDDTKYEHALPYRYILPVNYDSSKKYPILMYLHGAGRRGNDNENQLNNPKPLFERLLNEENINKYPCIIVAPQCPEGEQWVDTPWGKGTYKIDEVPVSDELSMAKDLILDFENRFSVDTDRVYIAGQSMGGYGTWDMIMRNPDMFAAAIPQCAAGDVTQADKLVNMAIWAHHGEADDTVPLSGSRDMVAALKSAGSKNVRYTQYPSVGHEVQVETFKEPDLLSWLFSKSLTTNADVEDDYTYLKVNDVLIRNYTDENPRPVKQNGKVYVSAKYIADEFGLTLENQILTKGDQSLALNNENSINVGSALMADADALADAFGIGVEFDEVSNTLGMKAGVQRAGALKVESVTASDREAANPEQYAIDGKTDTRWSAMVTASKPENTAVFDLGSEKSVSSVQIFFFAGNARSYDFDIKLSKDGQTWTTTKTFASSGNTNGFETFELDNPVNARYVQFAGRGSTVVSNASKNAYNSFWEFEIYGADQPGEESTAPPTEPTLPPEQPTTPDYLTIQSAEGDRMTQTTQGNGADKAIDGDSNTRWASSKSTSNPTSTITFDLGEVCCVSKVNIAFYAAAQRKYDFDIKVSKDGQRWKTVKTAKSNGSTATEDFTFDKINTRYIQYVGRGAVGNDGVSNDFSSFWEFKVFGINTADATAPNAPSFEDKTIEVVRDEDTTTESSIGLKWTFTGEEEERPKFYRVKRLVDGVVEFRTEGEVSEAKYVDTGSSQRPEYGPYESDYELRNANEGDYFVTDYDRTKKAPLGDAGETTQVYESYEGIPLVAGGVYDYIVEGYNASNELVALSAATPISTKPKAKSASLVFKGEPQAGLQGYNMSVVAVKNIERVDGVWNNNAKKFEPETSVWRTTEKANPGETLIGLKFSDDSELVNTAEDKRYVVKITWAAKFVNPQAWMRIKLQRTANAAFNATKDDQQYIAMECGTGGMGYNGLCTREIAYKGKNTHSFNVDGADCDIVINPYYAGYTDNFYIKSIEVTEEEDKEQPFLVRVPEMFSDNMMIQRDKPINIWGRLNGTPRNEDTTYKSATVTAVLKDETGAVVETNTAETPETRDGDWTITLPAQEYVKDKSYSLEITAESDGKTTQTKTINNIIFGDVYLCSGQSNMRYGYEYQNFTDYHDDVDTGKLDNPNIRIISTEIKSSENNWNITTVGWRTSSSESIPELSFSATASYFGKHLYEGNGNIPVGLISSAVGGASIDTFLTRHVDNGLGRDDFGNSVLYKSMIYPYTNWKNDTVGNGTQLAGILWYQGEADASGASISMAAYTRAMETMVTDYREVFGDAALPFLYVQLASFDQPNNHYQHMREAQLNYMIGKNTVNGRPENVGMAVITDNTDNIKDIHPRNKTEVGRRLSLWARKLVYHQEDIEYTGPIFEATEPVDKDGKKALKITFEEDSVMNGLKIVGDKLLGMKIAGADKSFEDVTGYELADDNKSIIVWSDAVAEPEYVEYAFEQVPTIDKATLFNADDLPASAFRNYDGNEY